MSKFFRIMIFLQLLNFHEIASMKTFLTVLEDIGFDDNILGPFEVSGLCKLLWFIPDV